MSVPYHAWTHSKDGTDPIDFPAATGGGILWALAYGNDTFPVVSSTTYPFTFLELYSNDSSAFEAKLVSSVFRYVQINEPGYYRMSVGAIHATNVFGASSNDLRLDCTFVKSGIASSITQNMGDPDFPGVRFTDADAVITGHEEPGGLFTQIAFNWDPDDPNSDLDDENPLLVGAMIAQAGGPSSIPVNVRILLERMADPGYTQLYP